MLSNTELVERFVTTDRDAGSASNMAIQRIDGYRVLVGYGHAVYAADTQDGVLLFGEGFSGDDQKGWAGRSSSTTKHVNGIKQALITAEANFRVVDRRLGTDDMGGVVLEEMR